MLMDVREQILAASAGYTPSERRVADVCIQAYPRIAFDTVARIATESKTSPPTVIRFATKAGFGGFADMQQRVRASLEGDWSRAIDRLDRREGTGGDWLARGLAADIENLTATYRNITVDQFADIAALLADPKRHVYFAGGEITHGLCLSAAALFGWLRDDVNVIGRTPAETPTQLSAMVPGAVLVAFHLRRLTHHMRDVIEVSCAAHADVIVVTNSPTLPLPDGIRHVIVLHMRGAGDILDSYTAATSLVNTLAAEVAHLTRSRLRTRFDRLERTWTALDVYVE
jgi:DNA-binding MurR/RpiR family transcriptional regulator